MQTQETMRLHSVFEKIKAELYYWDYTKIKSFHTAKEINKTKRQPTKWEKIFANNISGKGVNIQNM